MAIVTWLYWPKKTALEQYYLLARHTATQKVWITGDNFSAPVELTPTFSLAQNKDYYGLAGNADGNWMAVLTDYQKDGSDPTFHIVMGDTSGEIAATTLVEEFSLGNYDFADTAFLGVMNYGYFQYYNRYYIGSDESSEVKVFKAELVDGSITLTLVHNYIEPSNDYPRYYWIDPINNIQTDRFQVDDAIPFLANHVWRADYNAMNTGIGYRFIIASPLGDARDFLRFFFDNRFTTWDSSDVVYEASLADLIEGTYQLDFATLIRNANWADGPIETWTNGPIETEEKTFTPFSTNDYAFLANKFYKT
jgi:hypothetical protein